MKLRHKKGKSVQRGIQNTKGGMSMSILNQSDRCLMGNRKFLQNDNLNMYGTNYSPKNSTSLSSTINFQSKFSKIYRQKIPLDTRVRNNSDPDVKFAKRHSIMVKSKETKFNIGTYQKVQKSMKNLLENLSIRIFSQFTKQTYQTFNDKASFFDKSEKNIFGNFDKITIKVLKCANHLFFLSYPFRPEH